MKAAVYGTVAGILFGLSRRRCTKPTLEFLQRIDELLSHWEPYALAIAGILGFVIQQISLGTGKLAPSVAAVSVANPVVGILLGVVLLEERLSRPAWHVVVACIGLGLALAGAVVDLPRAGVAAARAACSAPDLPRVAGRTCRRPTTTPSIWPERSPRSPPRVTSGWTSSWNSLPRPSGTTRRSHGSQRFERQRRTRAGREPPPTYDARSPGRSWTS